jgi:cellulose synthase/poly-beta-1,6-N-acetylglucosamine synthase-like glycosyltransferase
VTIDVLDLALMAGGVFYGVFALWLLVGVEKSRRRHREAPAAVNESLPSVSIIVSARNEAPDIDACLEALAAQQYCAAFQVIVVNDHSTDDTAARVRQHAEQWPGTGELVLIEAPDPPLHAGPKKNALAGGIAASDGELLLFTDADCQPPPGWVASMVDCFVEEQVGLVAGYADRTADGFLARILAVDDLGIGALGEGGIGHGAGLSCTGRSLAYRRRLYDEVGGFASIGHLISGDDVYFLRHVAASGVWQMRYNAAAEAVVRETRERQALGTVFRQKLRHASKASRYEGAARLLGLGVYAYHLALAAGVVRAVLGGEGQIFFCLVWGSRWVLDLALLWRFAPRPEDRRRLLHLPFLEFLYIPYVLLFVPLARIVGFRWRDA